MTRKRATGKTNQAGDRKDAGQFLAPPRPLRSDLAAIWKRTTELLADKGLLDPADAETIYDYCSCVATMRELEAQIEHDGLVIEGAKQMVRHPALSILKATREHKLKLDKELCLTPQSRRRMGLDVGKQPELTLDDILAGAGDEDEA